jgi:hypothetical protein
MVKGIVNQKGNLSMQKTDPRNVVHWIEELENISTGSCMNPNFLKPFHFVTLGLAAKQNDISLLELPAELVTYASRMKLWQSVDMLPPCQVNERAPDGRFLPIHRFKDNDRNVQEISKANCY